MHKLTEKQKLEAVVLYNNTGLSIGDVASRYGISRQAMWDVLRRRTKLRPQQRRGADNHFYRGGSRENDNAQNKIEKAILRGRIKRPDKCQNCGQSPRFKDGRSGIQAHHVDYNKPLEVMWLCQPCHHEWHKKNKAIPKITALTKSRIEK